MVQAWLMQSEEEEGKWVKQEGVKCYNDDESLLAYMKEGEAFLEQKDWEVRAGFVPGSGM